MWLLEVVGGPLGLYNPKCLLVSGVSEELAIGSRRKVAVHQVTGRRANKIPRNAKNHYARGKQPLTLGRAENLHLDSPALGSRLAGLPSPSTCFLRA
jgi:hypothetical protein